jgi:hypothetical protein
MVDHCARRYVQLRKHIERVQLTSEQAVKLDSMAARTYADDADIRIGALSAPRDRIRPGQRDDVTTCSFIGTVPII